MTVTVGLRRDGGGVVRVGAHWILAAGAPIVHCLLGHSTTISFMMRLLPLAVAVAGLLQYVQAGTYDHRYKKGEHVELWVSKVRGRNHGDDWVIFVDAGSQVCMRTVIVTTCFLSLSLFPTTH